MGAAMQHSATRPPQRGERLPDLPFTSFDGERFRLTDFRGRKNIVLIFAGESQGSLVEAIARRHEEFQQADVEVIAVVEDTTGAELPFRIAKNTDELRDSSLSPDEGESSAVYVADRWGEVFHAGRTPSGESDPTPDDILEWIQFVEHQCEECFPFEWQA